jgi:hypothetical protein
MIFQIHPQIQLPEHPSHLTRNAYFCWDMSTGEHKSMKAIAGRLHDALQDLENGALDLERVDELCEEARELYERLVVLRFKAMEDEVGVSTPKAPEGSESSLLADKLISPNQTSLIDAIKEATVPIQETLFGVHLDVAGISEEESEVEESTEDVDAEDKMDRPAPHEFGISVSAVSRKIEEINELEEESEVEEEKAEVAQKDLPEEVDAEDEMDRSAPHEFGISISAVRKKSEKVAEVENKVETEEEAKGKKAVGSVDIGLGSKDTSINDRLSSGRRELSLADKLGMTPIADLKKAISLNQKFLFINELFDKKDTVYHEAISEINTFNSYDEAWNYLELNCGASDWNLEDHTVEQFLELIERRFLEQ